MGYLNLKGSTEKQQRADANRRAMAIRRAQERAGDAEAKRKRLLRRNASR